MAGDHIHAGFDPDEYFVGQRLWLAERRGNKVIGRPVVVSKVGRKWVNLDDAEKGYSQGRVERGSVDIDGGGYVSPGRLFADEATYLDFTTLAQAWIAFKEAVRDNYRIPSHLTIADLQEMSARLSTPTDGEKR